MKFLEDLVCWTNSDNSNRIGKGSDLMDEEFKVIWENKKCFHMTQSRLPIEEKIRIVVELQKIYLTVRKRQNRETDKRVWEID